MKKMLLVAIPLLLAGCASFVLVPRKNETATEIRYEDDREVAVQEDLLSGVAVSGQTTSSYIALHVAVMNKGLETTNVIPEDIRVRARESGFWKELRVYSAAEFMQSARDKQSAAIGLQALAGFIAASGASRTTIYTYRVYPAPPSRYYYQRNRYRRYFTVVTTTHDAAASAEVLGETAEQIARTTEQFDNYLDYLNATLLKKNSVDRGESVEGDVMVEYSRGDQFEVTVPFGDRTYLFRFSRRDLSS